jgi:hypothetical protein
MSSGYGTQEPKMPKRKTVADIVKFFYFGTVDMMNESFPGV